MTNEDIILALIIATFMTFAVVLFGVSLYVKAGDAPAKVKAPAKAQSGHEGLRTARPF